MAHFNPAACAAAVSGDFGFKAALIVDFIGCRIGLHDARYGFSAIGASGIIVVKADVHAGPIGLVINRIIEHAAFPCGCEDQKLMAQVATNGPCIGTHWHGLKA